MNVGAERERSVQMPPPKADAPLAQSGSNIFCPYNATMHKILILRSSFSLLNSRFSILAPQFSLLNSRSSILAPQFSLLNTI
jgi:hypothetical protein